VPTSTPSSHCHSHNHFTSLVSHSNPTCRGSVPIEFYLFLHLWHHPASSTSLLLDILTTTTIPSSSSQLEYSHYYSPYSSLSCSSIILTKSGATSSTSTTKRGAVHPVLVAFSVWPHPVRFKLFSRACPFFAFYLNFFRLWHYYWLLFIFLCTS
jgi:hypothetical protein